MKRLNWIVECILSIITCGIYAIFFWYRADTSMRTLNTSISKPVLNYWLAFLIGLVTGGIVMWVYYYQFFTAMEEEANRLGINKFYSPIVSLLIMFVPFYSFYYLCDYLNTVAEAKGIIIEA